MSGCRCSRVPGVTFVAIRGNTIGLVGLSELFKTWSTENISPAVLSDMETVEALRARNYVSDPAYPDYASAVRSLYLKVAGGQRS